MNWQKVIEDLQKRSAELFDLAESCPDRNRVTYGAFLASSQTLGHLAVALTAGLEVKDDEDG